MTPIASFIRTYFFQTHPPVCFSGFLFIFFHTQSDTNDDIIRVTVSNLRELLQSHRNTDCTAATQAEGETSAAPPQANKQNTVQENSAVSVLGSLSNPTAQHELLLRRSNFIISLCCSCLTSVAHRLQVLDENCWVNSSPRKSSISDMKQRVDSKCD